MNEERFERSADMRLVELRREQLGIAKAPEAMWQSRAVADLPFGPAVEAAPVESGAVLTLQATASPKSGLIPGAIVTVGLSVVNEGDKAARAAIARLPLPAAMEYRPGSLQIDGRDATEEAADALFGTGLDLGTLAGAQRVTVLLKLAVKAGVDDPLIAPSLTCSGTAVAGAKALRLERSIARTAFAAKVEQSTQEQPFYELEAEESIPYEAVEAALAPIVPPSVVKPPAAAPLLAAPPAPSTKPDGPLVDPGVPAAPAAPPPPPAPPAVKPAVPKVSPGWAAVAPERPAEPTLLSEPTLTTVLEKAKIATLGQFFSAARSFGMAAHYLLLSALACTRTLPREGSGDEIAAFFSAQDALLTKALIAKRLGKTVTLSDVAAPMPAFPPAFPPSCALPGPQDAKNGVILYRSFTVSELDFVGRAVANTGSPPFTRAGQLSVGLCAKRVIASDPARAQACEGALVAYAASASSEINRLFVRARLDKRTDLFGPSSAQFDAHARAVLSELAALSA
ncbi:MAG TPA: hypothetical protein VN905_07295 [Candidatus Binatia bacterium]|nr:hypothetical protein [Candidatus Binatia bacterium]